MKNDKIVIDIEPKMVSSENNSVDIFYSLNEDNSPHSLALQKYVYAPQKGAQCAREWKLNSYNSKKAYEGWPFLILYVLLT